jgi:hypothetical protein
MRLTFAIVSAALLMGSCASPPMPPTVDEARRHPVNVASLIELQTCKGELQGSRILLSETTRLAERANAMASRLMLEQQAQAAKPHAELEMANAVYTIRFSFGSADVVVPAADSGPLIEQVRASSLVMLRARTDGQTDALSESRIARERALAVRSYLIKSGIDPTRIRMTWQPIGDNVADNGTASGRALNRRVEIELYHFAPRRFEPDPSTSTH